MPGPIFSPVGVATAFMPYSADHAGASAESSLLSPPAGEAAVLGEPPSAEGTLVPYRPSQGPFEWPSRDDDGDSRFVLNDSREDKLWRHVGRQGLEAQEVLASAKGRIALLLGEVEQAEKLVTSGLPPAVGVKSFRRVCFFLPIGVPL
jgi:hypothetical protein